jgi:subtilisin family serine protease
VLLSGVIYDSPQPFITEPAGDAVTDPSSTAVDDGAFFISRLAAHSLTADEMLANDIADIEWGGRRVYARQGEWIVKFDQRGLGQRSAADVLNTAGFGAAFRKTLGRKDVAVIKLADAADVSGMTTALARGGVPGRAEPNTIIWADATPNDTDYSSKQWSMNNTAQDGGSADADIDAPEAWDVTTGSSSVVVGVVDTGVDYNHADLSGNIWTNPGETPGDGIDNDTNGYVDDYRGWDFVGAGDNNPIDQNGHGTHVAGTIAATGNNSTGVAGVAWTAKIMPLRVLGANGAGDVADAVEALNYATMMNVKVTNNSWNNPVGSTDLQDAITAAGVAGMLVVASAGNGGADMVGDNIDSAPQYPAAYTDTNVISVAATDRYDQLPDWSNYGPASVDLGAPGVDIYSTKLNGGYQLLSGTSMAAPHVTGAVVLLWSQYSTATAPDVKAALLNSADLNASLYGNIASGGRLNVRRALDYMKGHPTANTWTTTNADAITVRLNGSSVDVAVTTLGVTHTSQFALSSTGVLQIDADAGADSLTVDDSNGQVTIPIWFKGGDGDDAITGGTAEDRLIGGAGNDTIKGGPGTASDALQGDAGNDNLLGYDAPGVGGGGHDALIGGDDADTLVGGSGPDVLRGDKGDDDLLGGAGNDWYVYVGSPTGIGVDVIDGESQDTTAGTDTIDLSLFNVDVSLDLAAGGDRLSSDFSGYYDGANIFLFTTDIGDVATADNTAIENVRGTRYSDYLYGNSLKNVIYGNFGAEHIEGRAGDDSIFGGNTLNDSVLTEPLVDNADWTKDDLYGDDGKDTLTGGVGDDTLHGGAGNDTLNGNASNDTMDAGTAADGADTFNGGAGTDTADYSSRPLSAGALNISLDGNPGDGQVDTSPSPGNQSENDNVKTDVEVVKGGGANDTLSGFVTGVTLRGGGGNDSLTGSNGNDRLVGESGNDTLIGGYGDDLLEGETGDDALYGDFTTFNSAAYADTLNGGDNDDVCYGGSGDDSLIGGDGADVLHGENGDDQFQAADPGTPITDILYGGSGFDNARLSAGERDAADTKPLNDIEGWL